MKEFDQFRQEAIQRFDGDLSLIPSRIIPRIYRDNRILIPKGRTLVFMCAPSASGKSTFCSKYFTRFRNVKVVDADEILIRNTILTGIEDREASIEQWYRMLQHSLANNYVTVSDSNNLLVEMRANMLQRLKPYYDQTVMIVLDIPIETILAQLHKRNPNSDEIRSIWDRLVLDIQLENPKKYFVGIDKVCVVKDMSQVHIILTDKKA